MLSIPRSEVGSVRIDDILLEFRERDGGGRHYRGRTHFEEATSSFYSLLRNALSPRYCLDIGANYGFTGLLMHRAFPACHLTLVEPIPWLGEFIRHNFEVNGKGFDRFYPSVVGAVPGRTTFEVNTNASQDSRVISQTGWDVIETETITLSDLAADIPSDQGVYIKIDTQGWEENVFLGAEAFLTRHPRWFVKTEFAPMWLESSREDGELLLYGAVRYYEVFHPRSHEGGPDTFVETMFRLRLKRDGTFEFCDKGNRST